ncbi:MAG TPA: hypothetical protein VN577_15975 [Terriglobales bacterium]|nr:hypothetical protein [Terriglobales bacterium]
MRTSATNFEAFIYSATPSLAAQCTKSFNDLPANWISFKEPEVAADFLTDDRFDFVVLDLDCAQGRTLLQQLCDTGKARQSVVLAVTSGAVDASNLALCYKFGVFYPVRPSEIAANLHRSIPVAERLAQHRTAIVREAQPATSETRPSPEMPELILELIHTSKAFAWLFARLGTSILRRKHRLGIVAQERAASLLSAVATIWFVQESTENFRGLLHLAAPSAGPTYLLALSILLWICAKQRRFTSKNNVVSATRN